MQTQAAPRLTDAEIQTLERPHRNLWKYYIITSLFTGPAIIVVLPVLYFRYYTLRYRFDAEGIHMRVGILFRREVNLTYARIQDIHLKSGFIQRWLGIANLEVQTASGSATAELVVEGFKEYEAIRDFLYTRMRGYKNPEKPQRAPATVGGASVDAELLPLLHSIRDELRQTRLALERSPRTPPEPPHAP